MGVSTYAQHENSSYPKLSPPPSLSTLQVQRSPKRLGPPGNMSLILRIGNVEWWQNSEGPYQPTAITIQLKADLMSAENLYETFSSLPVTAFLTPSDSETFSSLDAEVPQSETTDSNSLLQDDDQWPDNNIPHSYLDIYSFNHPSTLEKYITQIGELFASIFPGCRHFESFPSRAEVMYHIVEEHITPVQKQYVCISCGAEFDDENEAAEHLISNNMPNLENYEVKSTEISSSPSFETEYQRRGTD